MTASETSLTVRIRRLPHALNELPARMTEGSSGFDLPAAIPEAMTLAPGATIVVPTGLTLEIPEGYEGQVRPRSGLALRHGITVLNGPGTIDADYRGEVAVILVNHGHEPHVIERGARVAQLVIQRLTAIRFEEVQQLSATHRGSGGFGSTGTGHGQPAA
ncbi:MAG: dUTP diphosphatase [Rhodospirillales bacterium]|nr:dUTP diphosphatase [Rhodospirillales bacterium]MDE0711844.1 dUTP diphosphatase [Rhodospirillales bacterium]